MQGRQRSEQLHQRPVLAGRSDGSAETARNVRIASRSAIDSVALAHVERARACSGPHALGAGESGATVGRGTVLGASASVRLALQLPHSAWGAHWQLQPQERLQAHAAAAHAAACMARGPELSPKYSIDALDAVNHHGAATNHDEHLSRIFPTSNRVKGPCVHAPVGPINVTLAQTCSKHAHNAAHTPLLQGLIT